jgi:hypothetical protein
LDGLDKPPLRARAAGDSHEAPSVHHAPRVLAQRVAKAVPVHALAGPRRGKGLEAIAEIVVRVGGTRAAVIGVEARHEVAEGDAAARAVEALEAR